jgi:hypothetical protein
LLAVSALTASAAQAEDVLYSRRMTKRGIDEQGNYNICKMILHIYLVLGPSHTHRPQHSSISMTFTPIWTSLLPLAQIVQRRRRAATEAMRASST